MEKCKTLGEENYFEFSYLNDELKIKYGFTVEKQTEATIDNSLIIAVINRINYLKTHNRVNLRIVGNYSLTHWEECPQTQYCPYVAKLVLDVFPNETIDKIINQKN